MEITRRLEARDVTLVFINPRRFKHCVGILEAFLGQAGTGLCRAPGFWQSAGFDILTCPGCGSWQAADDQEGADCELCRRQMVPEAAGWQVGAKQAVSDQVEAWVNQYTIRQRVRPPAAYAKNPDGSPSKASMRAEAVQSVVGDLPPDGRKFRMVVCKEPLPGLGRWKKTTQKPIAFMWPRNQVAKHGLSMDIGWYVDMLGGYVQGAFGFDDLLVSEQKTLELESAQGDGRAATWDF